MKSTPTSNTSSPPPPPPFPKSPASASTAIEGVHHYDLGTLIDQMGVAVRTGHHCCQPLMARFGITGTTRASFALYNNEQDIEALATALKKASSMLR
ncbi:MAG: aminotransferase class V-fold PLP-dependent enzyme [Akkermansiaceae bacterium]|nr:aminotransferase class V-fold PLP-dependent enzyme [Akkermansiaceae bacterium]